MGKPTGFMEYRRELPLARSPAERVHDWHEFHGHASEEQLRQQMKLRSLLVEGTAPGRWILLDYGDFIFHIFTEDCRRFYGLERLWGDAPNVTAEYTGEEQEAARPRRALKKTS